MAKIEAINTITINLLHECNHKKRILFNVYWVTFELFKMAVNKSKMLATLRWFILTLRCIILSSDQWTDLKRFYKDGIRFTRRCSKPDFTEFKKVAVATMFGVALMGGIGFFIKLLNIPINNILMAP